MVTEKKLCLACNRQFEDAGLTHCPFDSTQLVSLGRDETQAWCGKVIDGKYKILEAIGKGGLGTVYKAEELTSDRIVAIKLLKYAAVDAVKVRRFEQLATVAKAWNHPNSIQVYDHGRLNEQPYLVMEYIEGESLASILREHGPLPPVKCLQLFSQVMEGLKAAHHRGMLHRDVKPSNIIVVKGLVDLVKVVDFGLSGHFLVQLQDNDNGCNAISRSPIYMSPEQCQGRKLTLESDVYSLGVTLYEALTGFPVFKGRHAVQTATMHISSQPPPFGFVRPALRLSNKLQTVVFRALEKDPAARFQSMDEFQCALEEAVGAPEANSGYLGENEAGKD